MTDILGDSPAEYYTKEQARLYELSGAFRRIQTRMTLDALKVGGFEKGSKILDLGCGTGFSTTVLKESGFNATGCDVNPNMLYYAMGKKLHVVECDMHKLPFRDEEFDNLISISTIQWAKAGDYPAILSEINRVIKGSAVVQFYPKNSVEMDYFLKSAKKYFIVESQIIGSGNKAKTYITLKKKKISLVRYEG